MGKVRALLQYKETEGIVPNFVGPERGRPVMIRIHERGLFVRAKGKRDAVFISFDEIYGLAVRTAAHEKAKGNK